jgi:hypothetical protein
VWTFYLISVAEDARFELARACTQHAFQVCGSAFTPGQGNAWPAWMGLAWLLANRGEHRRMRLELRLRSNGASP